MNGLDLMVHRGPDDSGVEILSTNDDQVVALGHRRLAILDLSEMGHQPMRSPRTGTIVVFNGEIYNFLEIRKKLQDRGYTFRSNSDTEVILAAYDEWGKNCFNEFNGMFAICLYNPKTRSVLLCRDRVGIKPLYYLLNGNCLAFGSELIPLLALKVVPPELNENAQRDYFAYGYFPGELTPLHGYRKLLPGHMIEYSLNDQQCTINQYWSAIDAFNAPLLDGSEEELTDLLESLLLDSIQHQMISDVPIGAFLSGGIDSATVTALMAKVSPGNIKTFTIGFSVPEWDEAPFAKKIANHLGTEHHEMYVSPKGLEQVVSSALSVYDEPFADTSSIPTLLLSQLTRKHVTVALSGDGGDELFYGYTRYRRASQFHQFSRLPLGVRKAISGLLGKFPSHRMQGWSYVLVGSNIAEHYMRQLNWRLPALIRGECPLEGEKIIKEVYHNLKSSDWHNLPPLADLLMYLPSDILTKVDRASMAVSLETRVPILDHRVVEFAGKLGQKFKYHNGGGKYLLRKVLSRHVPSVLWERPKRGFAIPLQNWFRNELREWVNDELLGETDWTLGVVNRELASKLVLDHFSGKADNSAVIWAFICWKNWTQRAGLAA